MSPRDLLSEPCWQVADLGHPLPDATHAVSMALPRWQDVIAYEEQDPSCRQALQTRGGTMAAMVATVFDDDGFAGELLNVGKRF